MFASRLVRIWITLFTGFASAVLRQKGRTKPRIRPQTLRAWIPAFSLCHHDGSMALSQRLPTGTQPKSHGGLTGGQRQPGLFFFFEERSATQNFGTLLPLGQNGNTEDMYGPDPAHPSHYGSPIVMNSTLHVLPVCWLLYVVFGLDQADRKFMKELSIKNSTLLGSQEEREHAHGKSAGEGSKF